MTGACVGMNHLTPEQSQTNMQCLTKRDRRKLAQLKLWQRHKEAAKRQEMKDNAVASPQEKEKLKEWYRNARMQRRSQRDPQVTPNKIEEDQCNSSESQHGTWAVYNGHGKMLFHTDHIGDAIGTIFEHAELMQRESMCDAMQQILGKWKNDSITPEEMNALNQCMKSVFQNACDIRAIQQEVDIHNKCLQLLCDKGSNNKLIAEAMPILDQCIAFISNNPLEDQQEQEAILALLKAIKILNTLRK